MVLVIGSLPQKAKHLLPQILHTIVAAGLGIVCGAPAAASERANWDFLQDSLLLEAIDGDIKKADRIYTDLVRNLSSEDPTRAEALYWSGRTRLALGDEEGAREVLREGVRAGQMRKQCLDLLGQMELERTGITTIPVEWPFDTEAHGFVHPWHYADKGAIRIRQSEVLSWTTTVDSQSDRLIVGFRDPTPQPRGMRFRVQAVDIATFLNVEIYDVYGRIYHLPVAKVDVPVGRFVQVVADFRTMVPLNPNDGRLIPSRIDRLVLEDVTGAHGGSGSNEILIDDFEVY
ncbi:MAG: tetratricopeptide repeat protein [Proteobacteria bacterium]|nr:tetratricopeptide repeat protein [Pseudomonadota bacterium]